MILYTFRCISCEHQFDDLIKYSQLVSGDYELTCPECNQSGSSDKFQYVPSATSVRTDNNSATYVDGTKRKGFKDLAESFALEAKSYELPPEKRGPIEKEINKLRGARD